jgi:hypothetical protein
MDSQAPKSPQPDLHLHNAARTLERILNRRDPDHVYTVEIGPRPARPKEES